MNIQQYFNRHPFSLFTQWLKKMIKWGFLSIPQKHFPKCNTMFYLTWTFSEMPVWHWNKKKKERQQKSQDLCGWLVLASTQTYLFGEGDGISVKSVSQMRVQLESRCNLHNLQKNRILLIMPKTQRCLSQPLCYECQSALSQLKWCKLTMSR